MPTFVCPVTWPIEASAGDLIPAYARPQHQCTLPADHVHKIQDFYRIDEQGRHNHIEPHRCHCGSWQPVEGGADGA